MRFGKEAACVCAGLLSCLLFAGCVAPERPVVRGQDAHGFAVRPQPAPAAADLRIPAEARAAAEIPIVPLPVPPVPSRQAPTAPAANPRTTAPPPMPAAPVANEMPPATPVVGMENVRRLHRLASDRYDGIDSYIARLTRREQVRGENKPEELMLFKFRKEPWSVYFKWLGPAGRGREVIFVNGKYENKIHTLLAAGDMPLAPAGKRLALPPDSILVRSASRHPVTEAGLGASIGRLGRVIEAVDRGDQRKGTLNDLGLISRPEFARPVPAVEHILPPGLDPNLPRGGRCLYCFNPENNLPVLVSMRDHLGQEVEYYFYDLIQFPVRLDDNDFDPDKMWAKPAARP